MYAAEEEQRRWKEGPKINDKTQWQEKVTRRNEEVRKPHVHVNIQCEDGRIAEGGPTENNVQSERARELTI